MKNYNITATYDGKDAAAPWLLSTGLTAPPEKKGNYKKLKVEKGEDGDFHFTIQPTDIKFDPANPIDVRAVDPNKTHNLGQFTLVNVNGNKLHVHDDNIDQDVTEYYYQLNFVGKPPLDPIIQNGCCQGLVAPGGGMSMLSNTGTIALILLAVAAAIFFVSRYRRARS